MSMPSCVVVTPVNEQDASGSRINRLEVPYLGRVYVVDPALCGVL